MPSMGRSLTLAHQGMVCAPHYLAAQAGIRLLQSGGNAIDAAVATSATLNVVSPWLCGTGGDIFMIVYDALKDDLAGFAGSGGAPSGASIASYRQAGFSVMPERGPFTVTVPGTVDGWARALARYGKCSLAQVLAPAIEYAEKGFPVTPLLHAAIARFNALPDIDHSWRAVYLPGGRVPPVGSLLRSPDLAQTLRAIASHGAEAFYTGSIARQIAQAIQQRGGFLSVEDLAAHEGQWVAPLAIKYHDDLSIYELPPPTQGVTALQMLKLVEPLALASRAEDEFVHLLVEAKKLAFADRVAFLSDPLSMSLSPETLLNEEYLAKRRALIDPDQAVLDVSRGDLAGDTVYMCAVDGEGNAVSLIQSNYRGFGSGIVVPGTGVSLHNRGAYFSLEENHPNALAPRKRTLHTLIPSLACHNDRPAILFGCMGGDGQAQTHLQVYTTLLEHRLDIQAAINAPRWLHQDNNGPKLYMENRFSPQVVAGLRARGHDVILLGPWEHEMGHAQGIVIDPLSRVLMGGADPRTDSAAAGW